MNLLYGHYLVQDPSWHHLGSWVCCNVHGLPGVQIAQLRRIEMLGGLQARSIEGCSIGLTGSIICVAWPIIPVYSLTSAAQPVQLFLCRGSCRPII